MIDVIAEFGQTNEGSLETAFNQAMIAADAGCTWAKWQLLTCDRLVTRDAPIYWGEEKGDYLGNRTQWETFARNQMIDYSAWGEVKQCCDDLGLGFLATPFDLEAVDALEAIGVTAYKIASGDITYKALLEAVGGTGKHVFLSTGASDEIEVQQALGWLNTSVTILACDLVYPCPHLHANLGRIETLRHLFPENPIGYSDHTPGISGALAATALGAVTLEKHATHNPGGHVPDDAFAVDATGLRDYVRLAELGSALRGDLAMRPSVWEMRARIGARRGTYAARPISKGQVFTEEDFIYLRPCPDGIVTPAEAVALLGRPASRDLGFQEAIHPVDVQPPEVGHPSGSAPCNAGSSSTTAE